MFEWVTEFVKESGYLGVAFLMLLENIFPPIPSELIMPMAGFSAADGELSLPLVIVAGSIGSVTGALIWYYVGRWIGLGHLKSFAGRHGRFLTVTPAEIDRAAEWFGKYCGRSVFFGRLVPAVRTLISVPAGVAGCGYQQGHALRGSALYRVAAPASHGARVFRARRRVRAGGSGQ